jgi:hypothetical protein
MQVFDMLQGRQVLHRPDRGAGTGWQIAGGRNWLSPRTHGPRKHFSQQRDPQAWLARLEIASKFDKIVAFAEVEKFSRHMDDVSHREGRTVLFVSQNMGAVRAPARKCI